MTHQVRRILLTLLCLTASAATVSQACAQTAGQAPPEVQIDASVLNELAPAAGAAARPNLSRPVARPAQPVLTTGPAAQPSGYQYQQPSFRPTQQKVVPMPPPSQSAQAQPQDPTKPYAMRRTGNIQPIVPREAQRFPVQQRVRSDSFDPAGPGGLTRSAGTALPPSAITPREVMSAPALPPTHAETAPNGVPTLSRKIPIIQPPSVPAPVVAAPSMPKPVVASKPAPLKRTAEVKPKAKTASSAVKTAMMPVPARKPAAIQGAALDVTAPVPARRPETVASLPDVTAPVADVTAPLEKPVVAKPVEKTIAAGLPPTNLPVPPRPGRMPPSVAGSLPNAPKVMPAVPTRSVGAEVLPAVPGIAVADANDPLLLQLKDFDRQSFIKQVEGITAGLAPVPARKPQRGGMPPGLNKSNYAVLTPRGEMSKTIPGPSAEPLPKETPVAVAAAAAAAVAAVETAEDDAAAKVAAIEPAAGGEKFASRKIDRTPRPPPGDDRHESAFVTVPFMPGDEKASDDVIKKLEAEVIPLLKANPGWRVQIQAFSSPDNEVRSSARRTALTRALSVREYLMDKGIDAPRMDIRALGMETDRDPLDRIDLVFFDPAKNS